MERALFIAKTKNVRYFTSALERLYFGTEFCERLVPSAHDIRQVLDFVREKETCFSLVTPYVTGAGLKSWQKIIELVAEAIPGSEIIFNDWGMYRTIRKISDELEPVLGRLLTKIKRGPRLMNALESLPPDAKRYFKSTNLTVPNYRAFLQERGIKRAELDYPLQDLELGNISSEMHLSLYIPFVYVTTTRFCLTASCDIPEQKGMIGIFPCKKECQKYTFTLDNPVMTTTLIRKGNTIFYKNEKIPTGDELREKGIDRLVIQPEIPV